MYAFCIVAVHLECGCEQKKISHYEKIELRNSIASYCKKAITAYQVIMSLLKVVVTGTHYGGKKSLVKRFLQSKTDSKKASKSSNFDQVPASLIHDQIPFTVHGIKYSLRITETLSWETNFEMDVPFHHHDADVIIVVFSAYERDSYKSIEEKWTNEVINCCQSTSVLLVRYQKKQNIFFHSPISRSWKPLLLVTTEMGEQLAQKINATMYLECPENNETQIDNVFQIAARASIHRKKEKRRKNLLAFRTDVVGSDGSGKADLIRSFVFGKRLSVCDEHLNEDQLFHNLDDTSFFTSIELNGEEFNLYINQAKISADNLSRRKAITNADVIVLVFSVSEPDSFEAVRKGWISQFTKSDIFVKKKCPPIVIVGNQTHLTKTPKASTVVANISTSATVKEMGDQLAQQVNAVKYLEWSSTDNNFGKKVFEEAIQVLDPSTNKKKVKSIVVLGSADSEKTFLIKNYLQDEHVDLPINFQINGTREVYKTFVRNDGKELNLQIREILASPELFQSKDLDDIDFIVVVFSTAEPSFCIEVVDELIKAQKTTSLPPIIFVENQTCCKNQTNLVTSEMIEALACKTKITKLSTFDETGLKIVFEEGVWFSLRKAEEKRRKETCKPGFLERFSKWLFSNSILCNLFLKVLPIFLAKKKGQVSYSPA